MKTKLLLILLLGFAGLNYAQTKPNKQQAVNELNSILGKFLHVSSYSSTKSFLKPNDKDVVTVYFKYKASVEPESDCVLHIDYEETYRNGYDTNDNYSAKLTRMSIDMSRVSEIIPVLVNDHSNSSLNGLLDPNNHQWDYVYNLHFVFVIVDDNSNVIGKTNLILHQVKFPFSQGEPDMEEEIMKHKNSHVYKVFNLLRKLCDAPEPLNWD